MIKLEDRPHLSPPQVDPIIQHLPADVCASIAPRLWHHHADRLDDRSYSKIVCPSSSYQLDPSVVIVAQKMGAALDDMSLTWGSVDGVRLAVMKKEWLDDEYEKFHDKGDGEWFVTTCLISGMEKDYAIALRTALLRALKLPVNADRPIEEVEKEWQASWNADAVHQEAEAILAGRSPKGVEIRYTGQSDPEWWLPATEKEKRRAEAAEKAREEQQRQVDQAREDIADAEKAKSKRQQIAQLEDILENLEKASELNKKAGVFHELIAKVEEKLAQLKISTTLRTVGEQTVVLDKQIGSGGYGVVFKGKCNGQECAVKKFEVTQSSFDMFRHEGDIMKDLKSPHLVVYLDSVTDINNYYLVMEYMSMGSLWDLLHPTTSANPMTYDKQFNIAKDIVSGLQYLHDKKIIHRDLKSYNVLIGSDHRAKLGDFGLAKIKIHTSTYSSKQKKETIGTLPWLAPEILREPFPGHSAATDIYSFGLVLWEIVTAKQPFERRDANEIRSMKEKNYHEQVPDDAPKLFWGVMHWCWREPTKRPTATQLLREKFQDIKRPASNNSGGISVGGISLFENKPITTHKTKPPAASQKPAPSMHNTGGFLG